MQGCGTLEGFRDAGMWYPGGILGMWYPRGAGAVPSCGGMHGEVTARGPGEQGQGAAVGVVLQEDPGDAGRSSAMGML